VQINGWTVAVLGIDEVLDPADEVAGPDKPGTAAGHNFALALRAVRDAAASSDLVVVMIHWGVELDALPRPYQVHQAHRMIDAGADVIFGSHSHRVQPMETYQGRPIFYSLGNFVWPRLTPTTWATVVAEVTVAPDGTITGRLLPAQIVSDGHPVLGSARQNSDMCRLSHAPGRPTMGAWRWIGTSSNGGTNRSSAGASGTFPTTPLRPACCQPVRAWATSGSRCRR
jgi:poly-gamma-glutamate synthesis protein (capsule biosynthesis protein)